MPKTQGLSAKEKLAAKEYLVDLNQSAAYLRAGYKPGRTANQTSGRAAILFAKPSIQEEVQRLMAERGQRTLVTADRVVEELAKVGFASMRRFIRIDGAGNPSIDLSETPDDHLDALSEVRTEAIRQDAGDGDPVTTIIKTTIKLHDKMRALHDLAEHTGVFRQADKDRATDLAEAFQQIWARGSKAPLRRGGPPK